MENEELKTPRATDDLLITIEKEINRIGINQTDLSVRLGKSPSFIGNLLKRHTELHLDILRLIHSTLKEVVKEKNNELKLKHAKNRDSSVQFLEEVKDLIDWVRETKAINYQITRWDNSLRYKDRKEAVLHKNRPKEIIRRGIENDASMGDGENITFFSMLDPDDGTPFIKEFEVFLVKVGEKFDSPKHFHWGDEFCISIESKIDCYVMDEKKTKGREPVWSTPITLDEKRENTDFIWFEAWMPHYYKVKKEEAFLMLVLKDPRGASGFQTLLDNKVTEVKKEKRQNLSAVKTGIGIRLERYRWRAAISRTELSNRVERIVESRGYIEKLKMSRDTISRIERCEINPSYDELTVLCEALEIKLQQLIPGPHLVYSNRIEMIKSEIETLKYKGAKGIERKLLGGEEARGAAIEVSHISFEEVSNERTLTPECFENFDVAIFIKKGKVEFVFWESQEEVSLEQIKGKAPTHTEYLDKWSTIYIKNSRWHTLNIIEKDTEIFVVHLRPEHGKNFN